MWIGGWDGGLLWFVVVPLCGLESGHRMSGLVELLVIMSSFWSVSMSRRCRAKSDRGG